MSHRKVYSQGSIPFSWEDKPGISKVTTQADQNPRDYRVKALDLTSSAASISIDDSSSAYSDLKPKIPLPPCPTSQPPSRSNSAKGLKWQDDPFLLAYKECTKSQKKGKPISDDKQTKKGSKVRKSMFMYFSCKNSCDVRNENFVQLPQLPALPKHKFQNVVMENW